MNRWVVWGVGSLLVLAGASIGWSQEASKPEQQNQQQPAASGDLTEEEQQEGQRRAGKSYRTWAEMVTDWMTPRPVAKEGIVRIDEKHAYPHPAVGFKMEIVREDEDTVWLRGLPPEDPESALHDMWVRRQQQEIVYRARKDLEGAYPEFDYWLDFSAEIVPPPFMDAVTFEPVQSGLPTSGLIQMNLAMDDLNGDGVLDVVFPPERKGFGQPSVYLGRGDGTFTPWKAATWPANVPFDYGGIATGDFNADGHRDLVLAIHFKGQYVLFGNGKGDFSRAVLLPSPDPRITSRAPAVADLNGDGRDDVAFLAEIDYDLGTSNRIADAVTVWTVLSTASGWQPWHEGLPGTVIGDSLVAADLDFDGRADLAVASGTTDWRRLVAFNRGDEGWLVPDPRGVLSNSLHLDVAVHEDRGGAEVIATFAQFQTVLGDNVARTGVIRYEVSDAGVVKQGTPLVVDEGRKDSFFRVGTGDLDGDGAMDLVAGRRDGSIEVYLQTPSGDFYHEQSDEIASRGRPYDVQLVDLNGDGRDDLIVTFAGEGEQGGVGVWLSRSKIE